jgi:hypothetical protein
MCFTMQNNTQQPAFTAQLTEDQQKTFLDIKKAEAIVLQPGDCLWRFIGKRNRPKFSEYWVSDSTLQSIMRIAHTWEKPDQAALKQAVRGNLAVLTEWNSLNYRMQVRFKKQVQAYKGVTGPQKMYKEIMSIQDVFDANGQFKKFLLEARVGGFEQYVIPCLHGVSDAEGFTYAEICKFERL